MEREKTKMGRNTKYNDDMPKLARMHARDGLIDIEIAEALGISEQTLYNWQKKHVEFFEAIKKGKEPVDVEVEEAALKRAIGYEYEEKKYIVEPDGTRRVEKTVKHEPGNPTAQIFWLKNRRPDKWRDRKEHEHSGKDGRPIETNTRVTIDLSSLNDEELEEYERICGKITKPSVEE